MIELQNQANEELDQQYLLKVADIVLQGEKVLNKDLSIVFITPSEMKKINYEHLKKNKPTDVLSFELSSNDWIKSPEEMLGEIFICKEEVIKNKKQEDNLNGEISRVLIHGILHLCGYNHEKEADLKIMEGKEDFYLAKLK
jgi:probable rRNA maturation factor